MEKKYCDICRKEIKGFGVNLSGSKWKLWALISNFDYGGDFCSIKCLEEHLKKLPKNVRKE